MCAVTRNRDFFLTLAESVRSQGFHAKVESPTDSSPGFYDAAATAWMCSAASGRSRTRTPSEYPQLSSIFSRWTRDGGHGSSSFSSSPKRAAGRKRSSLPQAS